MADIQEVKSHLMNVYNSMNFLKKIGVPVGPYNRNIKNIMELMKADDIQTAKKEVLKLRKETGDVLTRMENIHNGLLQIDKEIARMVKKGKSTVALRRLYSQCRLALKEKDYDQVQLFIIKMDKIIDMYNFLEGPTLLVDIDEGREIEEIIIKMELDAIKKRKTPLEEKPREPPGGRYVEEDECLPVLTPLYEEIEEETPHGEGTGSSGIPTDDAEKIEPHRKMEVPKNEPPEMSERSSLKRSGPGETVVSGRETVSTWETSPGTRERVNEEKIASLSEEVHIKVSKLKGMMDEGDIIDGDIVRGLQVLERLEKSEDWVGAKELSDELEKLVFTHQRQREMASLSTVSSEAKKALLGLSEKIGEQKQIRTLYDRANSLRDSGDLEVSTRLFTEVIELCRESEIIGERETWLQKIDTLREKIEIIPPDLIDRASLLGRLNSISAITEEDNLSDIEALLNPVENEVERAYSRHRNDELKKMDEMFSKRMENSGITGLHAERIRGLQHQAREFRQDDEFDRAEETYRAGIEKMDITLRTADCEKELKGFLLDLKHFHGKEENRMRVERYVKECKNRIIQNDPLNFSRFFQKARAIAQSDIEKNKSISNLELLDRRIRELSEGELHDFFTKRYSEAKSKIVDGEFRTGLELTTNILNDITVRALEDIRNEKVDQGEL